MPKAQGSCLSEFVKRNEAQEVKAGEEDLHPRGQYDTPRNFVHSRYMTYGVGFALRVASHNKSRLGCSSVPSTWKASI